MTRRIIFLMYHELGVAGRPTCRTEPGYTCYVVKENEFRSQLAHLGSLGIQGMSVTEALVETNEDRAGVAITFDDGCETDLLAAAPLLQEVDFHATFYIVAGFVGRPGYLTGLQLRQLQDLGFEIGCHSMTHAFLDDLDDNGLQVEIVQAKETLEELTGKRVDHFSCPGGRWSRRVAQMAERAGYLSVSTSRIGANTPMSDRFRLARVALQAGTTLPAFDRLVQRKGLWRRQVRAGLLTAAKGILGNSMYEALRSRVMGRR